MLLSLIKICRGLERKSVERDLILVSLIEMGELKKLTPTPRTTIRTTPRTTLRTSPRTTLRTTLTNQPNLLSRRKELEEAYLPTRSHLINSRHLDFRHFTRPSPSSSLLRPLQLPFLDRHATLLSKPRVTIQITTACPT